MWGQRTGWLIPAEAATLAAQGCKSLRSSLLSKPLVAPETVKPSNQDMNAHVWLPDCSAGLSYLCSVKHINLQTNFQSRICLTHSLYGNGDSEFQKWFPEFLSNSSTQSTGESPISLVKSISCNLLTENCLRHWQIQFDHTVVTELYPEAQ